jgi:hypothetical protein
MSQGGFDGAEEDAQILLQKCSELDLRCFVYYCLTGSRSFVLSRNADVLLLRLGAQVMDIH